ncbi:sensor domain-containing diguanylate cyclase [Verminephrobacter eiseniae]|uniref:sensor domain-containing diguanylate cyclase n=2 Tax=Verminephrobacter eiseniae TaxID=364317 RepID=UPI002237A1AC|nr:diguanylate cyclase [Verminephrobacter eiseniae]
MQMGKRWWWVALVLALCPLWTSQAGAGLVRLVPGQGSYDLGAMADVLEDVPGRLRLDDVLAGGSAASAFSSHTGRLSSFGFTRSTFWFRVEIDNPAPAPSDMLLVLRTPWLDSVRWFRPDGQGGYVERLLGDHLPFKARSYATPQFLIDVPVLPGKHSYYLRLASAGAFMTPIELWSRQAFHDNDRLWAAYYGMFYGILCIMVLYNGCIWASTRDRSYFVYCLYLAVFFLMNFSYNGFAFQYFWPESPRWSNWSQTHWIFSFQGLAVLFTMNFLESKTRLPRMHRVLQAFLVVLVGSWIAVTVSGDIVAYHAVPIYFIFGCAPLILAAGFLALRPGYRAARFFVLAFVASITGSFFTALTVSGLIPYTFANFHASEFGLLADMVLLSQALADRVKLLSEQRDAAELREIEQKIATTALLKQANEDLERMVLERTSELARARDEAEHFARIDMLTGVANRRYFEEVATMEFARTQRGQQALSVILIDIDLFKQVNDRYGHAAGDAVIRAVARLAKESVRESDFVARIGGEEFSVLLPGIGQAPAFATAERLRERIAACVVEHDGHSLGFTASFGVSEQVADDPGFSSLLRRADQALYAAKQAGRNQVVVQALEWG